METTIQRPRAGDFRHSWEPKTGREPGRTPFSKAPSSILARQAMKNRATFLDSAQPVSRVPARRVSRFRSFHQLGELSGGESFRERQRLPQAVGALGILGEESLDLPD